MIWTLTFFTILCTEFEFLYYKLVTDGLLPLKQHPFPLLLKVCPLSLSFSHYLGTFLWIGRNFPWTNGLALILWVFLLCCLSCIFPLVNGVLKQRIKCMQINNAIRSFLVISPCSISTHGIVMFWCLWISFSMAEVKLSVVKIHINNHLSESLYWEKKGHFL